MEAVFIFKYSVHSISIHLLDYIDHFKIQKLKFCNSFVLLSYNSDKKHHRSMNLEYVYFNCFFMHIYF